MFERNDKSKIIVGFFSLIVVGFEEPDMPAGHMPYANMLHALHRFRYIHNQMESLHKIFFSVRGFSRQR